MHLYNHKFKKINQHRVEEYFSKADCKEMTEMIQTTTEFLNAKEINIPDLCDLPEIEEEFDSLNKKVLELVEQHTAD